jgi:hypothetical protein
MTKCAIVPPSLSPVISLHAVNKTPATQIVNERNRKALFHLSLRVYGS